MWRLRWFAHALITPSARLFDANIFHPEPRTLALSDAMIVEGAVAAPMLWAGMNPVLVHNLLLLGAIAMSGAAMFALVRHLTASRGAGVLAGIVFAFAPYRFEHIMHMELQWAMWMPLAFLALHRTLDSGRWQYGVATGACLALQVLSSIYYGIFLATLLPLGALLLLPRGALAPRRQVMAALAAGAALALVVAAAYARPYLDTRERLGDRPAGEVAAYSARPSSYLAATPSSWLYGGPRAARAGAERRLFPGGVPVLLAAIGLLLKVPGVPAMVYLLLLVAAFELSLGVGGYSFPFLQAHVGAYGGLRAPARLGIFVLLFLGVLAGYGYQAVTAGRSRAIRVALALVLAVSMLAEYRAGVGLTGYPGAAPPIYRLLASLPPAAVAEFPIPRTDALPGPDPEYSYLSSFHWFPLVNGYSGVYPPSYLERLRALRSFPDEPSMAQLRRDGVRYIVLHGFSYTPAEFSELQARLERTGAVSQLGRFDAAKGAAVLYQLQ